MRRTLLSLTTMVVALLLASGVAWAVNKIGTDGPDTLKGTNGDDNLIGKGGNDDLYSLNGRDTLLGGPGKDVVTDTPRQCRSEATRSFLVVPATISSSVAETPTTCWVMQATTFYSTARRANSH